ncbi:DUF5681 domain-containing protein [Luteolibacter sp. SL250]|uniref:DUF5681 domain-containing protein n=1 Tax=Luteolibacter sp. SL250 TaxID=2995170 RepID=UPI00227224DC|nr:DUF5681 domain-containing protein [Luteolibacter sp. SL250]WAC20903.1 DUF5681 domain-containing protein [Luteolibacter sp. SL250]
MSEDADYEVGYKKPPKKNQFPKGKSGNSQGRPKKDKSLQEIAKTIGGTKLIADGKSITLTEAVVRRAAHDAVKSGDAGARRFFADLLYDSQKDQMTLEDFEPNLDDEIAMRELLSAHEKNSKK